MQKKRIRKQEVLLHSYSNSLILISFMIAELLRISRRSEKDEKSVVMQMCLCLLPQIQTIVNKAKKMTYCAQNHLVSNCLLTFLPLLNRYCKNIKRVIIRANQFS